MLTEQWNVMSYRRQWDGVTKHTEQVQFTLKKASLLPMLSEAEVCDRVISSICGSVCESKMARAVNKFTTHSVPWQLLALLIVINKVKIKKSVTHLR